MENLNSLLKFWVWESGRKIDPATGERGILSGIQFTTHFIEIFVVYTKRFVGSFVNVILTRQTCGQRSSRAAESKR